MNDYELTPMGPSASVISDSVDSDQSFASRSLNPLEKEEPVPSINLSLNKRLKAKRASFHDYGAKGFYLITITCHPGSPRLSIIDNPGREFLQRGSMIIPRNTPLGDAVKTELLRIPEKEPKLKIRRYVIMPDHIHFVLQVLEKLKKPIGKHIAPFTTVCSKSYTSLFSLSKFTTLFQPFDDQIIFNHTQLDRSIKYVEDNPRRHIIRRLYKDLFRRHLDLTIDNHRYGAYGNIFLLKEPYLLQIRVHRRWTPQQFADYKRETMEKIRQGAIPISPAIHPVEKEIINEAIEEGSSVILLRDLGFNERFKPQGKYFDLCVEGRLLMLSPWPDDLRRNSTSGYTEFHQMNDYAAIIASLPSSVRLSIQSSL